MGRGFRDGYRVGEAGRERGRDEAKEKRAGEEEEKRDSEWEVNEGKEGLRQEGWG